MKRKYQRFNRQEVAKPLRGSSVSNPSMCEPVTYA
jgi:hypothetical protein